MFSDMDFDATTIPGKGTRELGINWRRRVRKASWRRWHLSKRVGQAEVEESVLGGGTAYAEA